MNFSWMVGDKESDIIAAKAAGIEKSILVRSGHKIDEPNSCAMFILLQTATKPYLKPLIQLRQ